MEACYIARGVGFQHAGRRHDKEVHVERIPLHFSQRCHLTVQAAACNVVAELVAQLRSEEHTSNSSHLGISYAVFCLKKKKNTSTRLRPARSSWPAPSKKRAPTQQPSAERLRDRTHRSTSPPSTSMRKATHCYAQVTR